MKIRPARLSERKSLIELQRRASLAWEDNRAQLLANPDAIDLPAEQIESGLVIVAEQGGVVTGFAVVLPGTDHDAELDGLFVEPAVWGGGVGRRLVEEARTFASVIGAEELRVVAHPRALGFYVACGFEETGPAQTRFGPALAMRLPLTSPA
jgi:GNAT superfamily N-acetyltransferase